MGAAAVPASLSWRGFRFRNEAMFEDGSFVVTPVVPSRIIVGSMGDDPVDVIPGLRVSPKGASWTLDTLALISFRNWLVPFKLAGDPTPARLRQEWVVPDSFRPDAPSGSVVLGRTQALPPGTLELIEIAKTGDTVWTRRVRLPPVPVEDHEVEAVVNRRASIFASWSGDSVPSPILRRRVRSALIVPEVWPVTYGIRLMRNGEIWFRPSRSPTPGVWYAVRRGETDGPIRRITLPESFYPRDVTDTHVWGERVDELGVQYIVGRRLIPAGNSPLASSPCVPGSFTAGKPDSASGSLFPLDMVSVPNLTHSAARPPLLRVAGIPQGSATIASPCHTFRFKEVHNVHDPNHSAPAPPLLSFAPEDESLVDHACHPLPHGASGHRCIRARDVCAGATNRMLGLRPSEMRYRPGQHHLPRLYQGHEGNPELWPSAGARLPSTGFM